MSRLSVSRRARLGIMAGVLATAGVAAVSAVGTANAAISTDWAMVNFANTRMKSVRAYTAKDGKLISYCVRRDEGDGPYPAFQADHVVIESFLTAGCVDPVLHIDMINQPKSAVGQRTWVIPLETLDDDDSEEWTKPPAAADAAGGQRG